MFDRITLSWVLVLLVLCSIARAQGVGSSTSTGSSGSRNNNIMNMKVALVLLCPGASGGECLLRNTTSAMEERFSSLYPMEHVRELFEQRQTVVDLESQKSTSASATAAAASAVATTQDEELDLIAVPYLVPGVDESSVFERLVALTTPSGTTTTAAATTTHIVGPVPLLRNFVSWMLAEKQPVMEESVSSSSSLSSSSDGKEENENSSRLTTIQQAALVFLGRSYLDPLNIALTGIGVDYLGCDWLPHGDMVAAYLKYHPEGLGAETTSLGYTNANTKSSSVSQFSGSEEEKVHPLVDAFYGTHRTLCFKASDYGYMGGAVAGLENTCEAAKDSTSNKNNKKNVVQKIGIAPSSEVLVAAALAGVQSTCPECETTPLLHLSRDDLDPSRDIFPEPEFGAVVVFDTTTASALAKQRRRGSTNGTFSLICVGNDFSSTTESRTDSFDAATDCKVRLFFQTTGEALQVLMRSFPAVPYTETTSNPLKAHNTRYGRLPIRTVCFGSGMGHVQLSSQSCASAAIAALTSNALFGHLLAPGVPSYAVVQPKISNRHRKIGFHRTGGEDGFRIRDSVASLVGVSFASGHQYPPVIFGQDGYRMRPHVWATTSERCFQFSHDNGTGESSSSGASSSGSTTSSSSSVVTGQPPLSASNPAAAITGKGEILIFGGLRQEVGSAGSSAKFLSDGWFLTFPNLDKPLVANRSNMWTPTWSPLRLYTRAAVRRRRRQTGGFTTPPGRHSHAMAAVGDDDIYISGGVGERGMLADLWRLSLASFRFETISTKDQPTRVGHQLLSYSGETLFSTSEDDTEWLIFIGGLPKEAATSFISMLSLSTLTVYNHPAPVSIGSRQFHCAIPLPGGRIIILGGVSSVGNQRRRQEQRRRQGDEGTGTGGASKKEDQLAAESYTSSSTQGAWIFSLASALPAGDPSSRWTFLSDATIGIPQGQFTPSKLTCATHNISSQFIATGTGAGMEGSSAARTEAATLELQPKWTLHATVFSESESKARTFVWNPVRCTDVRSVPTMDGTRCTRCPSGLQQDVATGTLCSACLEEGPDGCGATRVAEFWGRWQTLWSLSVMFLTLVFLVVSFFRSDSKLKAVSRQKGEFEDALAFLELFGEDYKEALEKTAGLSAEYGGPLMEALRVLGGAIETYSSFTPRWWIWRLKNQPAKRRELQSLRIGGSGGGSFGERGKHYHPSNSQFDTSVTTPPNRSLNNEPTAFERQMPYSAITPMNQSLSSTSRFSNAMRNRTAAAMSVIYDHPDEIYLLNPDYRPPEYTTTAGGGGGDSALSSTNSPRHNTLARHHHGSKRNLAADSQGRLMKKKHIDKYDYNRDVASVLQVVQDIAFPYGGALELLVGDLLILGFNTTIPSMDPFRACAATALLLTGSFCASKVPLRCVGCTGTCSVNISSSLAGVPKTSIVGGLTTRLEALTRSLRRNTMETPLKTLFYYEEMLDLKNIPDPVPENEGLGGSNEWGSSGGSDSRSLEDVALDDNWDNQSETGVFNQSLNDVYRITKRFIKPTPNSTVQIVGVETPEPAMTKSCAQIRTSGIAGGYRMNGQSGQIEGAPGGMRSRSKSMADLNFRTPQTTPQAGPHLSTSTYHSNWRDRAPSVAGANRSVNTDPVRNPEVVCTLIPSTTPQLDMAYNTYNQILCSTNATHATANLRRQQSWGGASSANSTATQEFVVDEDLRTRLQHLPEDAVKLVLWAMSNGRLPTL